MLRPLAWAGLIVSCTILFLVRTSGAAVVCGALAAASVSVLIWEWRHSRDLTDRLPRALKRLAYRSDENSVTFVWQWRHGGGGRMRILRSEVHSTDDPDGARAADQTLVYDGEGDQIVDSGVKPRNSYHYSLFARRRDGRWSTPVHQEVLTLSQEERESIDESADAPGPEGIAERDSSWIVPDFVQVDDPVTAVRPTERLDDHPYGLAYPLAEAATNAVFAVADVFAREKVSDGWDEIV